MILTLDDKSRRVAAIAASLERAYPGASRDAYLAAATTMWLAARAEEIEETLAALPERC